MIETPSWGYGDSGTRFGVFPQPGRPRDVFEKLDDAAEVHRLTGTAGAVALHFPWDAVDDYGELRAHDRGARAARRRGQPEPVPGPRLQARLDHAPRSGRARRRRSSTCSSASRSRRALGLDRAVAVARRRHELPGPGRPARAPRAGCSTASARVYAALPAEQELLVEYKLFEPAFYATDLADWGSALLTCLKLGERARVLVDLGHHAQGDEHRADRRVPGRRGPARRLPLQQPQVRRRRPDRRLGQPVRAVPDLRRAGRAGDRLPRLTIDQSHNVEAKVEAMVLSRRQPAGGLRQGAARRPRRAARGAGRPATCSAATRSCSTPTAPTSAPACAAARAALGAAEDPIHDPPRVGLRRPRWPANANPSRS